MGAISSRLPLAAFAVKTGAPTAAPPLGACAPANSLINLPSLGAGEM
jgi:hypothetical protein